MKMANIFERIFSALRVENAAQTPPPPAMQPETRPDFGSNFSGFTRTGERVSEDTAKRIATAYRCAQIISDDIAAMPLQMFRKVERSIMQVAPDPIRRNVPFMLEVSPNRWMTPFIFKKQWIDSLIWFGNAYIWLPEQSFPEMFLLDPAQTVPGFDDNGNLVYQTRFPNGEETVISGTEVNHLMINSKNGLVGRSVLTYARDTVGRQQGAHRTQDMIFSSGLNSAAIMQMKGNLNPEARARVRAEYERVMSGPSNAGRIAVIDEMVEKFDQITIKPVDAQFLETVQATDAQIANFFGIPLYKLNQGKQSYESNEQQNMDYLRTTLNPYLVQIEQAARLKWLPVEEQGNTYFRFIRESLLQTDAKSRAEYLEKQILSGQITPNEARQINDMSAYEGGDRHYIPANMMVVEDANSNLTPNPFPEGKGSDEGGGE